MVTSKVEYLGDLRTKCTHLKSGVEIITDAPVDNKGKGEAFSPTDLVATAYASCIMTIIGIYCNTNNIAFDFCESEITKVMGTNPRRISQLDVHFDFSKNNWDEKTQEIIQKVGDTCPVAKSVDPAMEIEITYLF